MKINSKTCVAILWLLFLVRGTMHIEILPTLEGFDSIGHIDYLQYLRDHDNTRSLGNMPFSSITVVLLRTLPSNKNLALAALAEQLSPETYESYFKKNKQQLNQLKVELESLPYTGSKVTYLKNHLNWQDKHPPAYYILVNAIVYCFSPKTYMEGIFLASVISLFFLSLTIPALYFIGLRLDRYFAPGNTTFLSLIFPALFLSQPMIYIFACRISNDSLAVPLNTFIIALIFIWTKSKIQYEKTWLLSIGIGIIMGIAIVIKTYALEYLLVLPLFGIYLFWRYRSFSPIVECILIVSVAATIASPTLLYHYQTIHSIDGFTIGTLSHNRILNTFLQMYVYSIEGYLQLFRMIITRLWIGNWSSIGNYLVTYLLYGLLFGAAVITLLWKRRNDLFKPENRYELDLFIFSMMIQLLLIAALANLGVKLYVLNPEAKNLAGYYAYAFYLSELFIIFVCLRHFRQSWAWFVLSIFMLVDLGGIIAQVLYYFGVANVGPLKMVIPTADWFPRLLENWTVAPWTFLTPSIFFILMIIFFVGVPTTLWICHQSIVKRNRIGSPAC